MILSWLVIHAHHQLVGIKIAVGRLLGWMPIVRSKYGVTHGDKLEKILRNRIEKIRADCAADCVLDAKTGLLRRNASRQTVVDRSPLADTYSYSYSPIPVLRGIRGCGWSRGKAARRPAFAPSIGWRPRSCLHHADSAARSSEGATGFSVRKLRPNMRIPFPVM
jgi:hypothetical protein